MKISILDIMIPKRWILLLRRYLPFFKKPEQLYFECRKFVDNLKKETATQRLSLDNLAELLVILETNSKNNSELIEFSKKIIGKFEQQLQGIDLNQLKQLLSKHNLEKNNESPILKELLIKLSAFAPTSDKESDEEKEIANDQCITIAETKELDTDKEFHRLTVLLKAEKIDEVKSFIQNIPNEQRLIMTDKLIEYFYATLKAKNTFITCDLKEKDFFFQILTYILELHEKEDHPINIMQFLAVTALLKLPINLEEINKFSLESTSKEKFSLELQEYLAENRVKALKDLIKKDFINKISEKPTRDGGIKRKFHLFYTDNYPNLNENPKTWLQSIFQKLPESTQKSNEDNINFIEKLFAFIYELLNSSAIRALKERRELVAQQDQRDYERLVEEKNALRQRILEGTQTSVSHQRMIELFGKEAPRMENTWTKRGGSFFNAADETEKEAALKEAARFKAVMGHNLH